MTAKPFYFKEANRFIPYILVIGIGIGTANFTINGGLNWIQWVVQSVVTSFIVGYGLVLIVLNKSWFLAHFKSKLIFYLFFVLAFFLIGVLATEIENLIRSLVFRSQQFALFSAGKMYVFNGIISLILGYSFLQNNLLKIKNTKSQAHLENQKKEVVEKATSSSINKIPVKQGDNIVLISIEDIVYFEAYDNYSFVYNMEGEKRLCDYSLIFLEKRLNKSFARVHRKYIVNKNHIKQITPHLNGRYLIMFDSSKIDSINSSKGYLETIKGLIKIQ